jgi:hypothetical protein
MRIIISKAERSNAKATTVTLASGHIEANTELTGVVCVPIRVCSTIRENQEWGKPWLAIDKEAKWNKRRSTISPWVDDACESALKEGIDAVALFNATHAEDTDNCELTLELTEEGHVEISRRQFVKFDNQAVAAAALMAAKKALEAAAKLPTTTGEGTPAEATGAAALKKRVKNGQ